MLSMTAVADLPILVLMLVLGAVAKVATAGSDAEPGGLTRLGPAILVPEGWRKPALIVCAAAELALAAGMLFWDSPLPRGATIAFFAVSTYVLVDLRRRRPDAGCGCFGEVSSTPVGLRSIGRTIVLTGMAAAVTAEAVDGAVVRAELSWTMAAWFAGGLVALMVLSPELEEAVARLRYRAPCEHRHLPVERSLSRLNGSAAWRSQRALLTSTEPTDVWRELCWRFFAYPARTAEGDVVEVVFAVYLSGRHAPVRSAVVTADGSSLASLPESIPVSASH
jgi:hypothetical protein